MNKRTTISLTLCLCICVGISQVAVAKNIISLHCGALDISDPKSETVFETGHVHMFFDNSSENYFLIVDFDVDEMYQYPFAYKPDNSPLLDESKKQTRKIRPSANQILDKPGVAYFSWVSTNPITGLVDEFIYVTSKAHKDGNEGYIGGVLTKIEMSLITTAPKPIAQTIKPSIQVSQYLCSRILDFSEK